jgi:uncharacterized protein (TIGR00369 family)
MPLAQPTVTRSGSELRHGGSPIGGIRWTVLDHDERRRPVTLPDLGTGFDTLIGIDQVVAGGDRVELRCTIRPELHQPFGIVHGGVYCAMIEAAASYGAALWLVERGQREVKVVGVHNATDFLRAITEGVVTAVATPLHRGRLQQLWLVLVTDDSGRTVARGQVRLQNLYPDHLPPGASRPAPS